MSNKLEDLSKDGLDECARDAAAKDLALGLLKLACLFLYFDFNWWIIITFNPYSLNFLFEIVMKR